jgi:hypothetical protein
MSKRLHRAALSLSALGFLLIATASSAAAEVHGTSTAMTGGASIAFGLLELPFLLVGIVFAFLTAAALRGGVFGRGMTLVAWGFLVMAIGHVHMQVEALLGVNLFATVLGPSLGTIAWVVALIVTWGFTGLGFYSIYRVSKSA